jgi:hypothetical protein
MSSGGLSIGELVGTVSLNDQFSGPINNVAKALGISSESFKAITGFAGLAAGAIVGATSAVIALGIRGSDIADVKDGFDNLSTAAGSTAEKMLGALQEGTLNTISNFDLMKLANTALGSGMVKSAADMETLAAGAKLLSGRVGGDTAGAFETLTTAISKGKTAQLKALGIFVDTDSALQNYAQSIHKTVPALSDHEKATALSQATLSALRKELDANGPPVASFSDRINQGKVAVQNFTDNVALAVANSPTVAVAMEAISSAIRNAFGGNNQQAIQTISGYINKFAIFLVDVASTGVSAAQFITNAFLGTKVIFNALLEAVATGYAKILGFMAKQAEAAAALPVVGGLYEELGKKLRSAADFAGSLAFGFGKMKDKALDSAATANAGFDTVAAALDKTKAAMEAVSGAQVVVKTTTEGVKTAFVDSAAVLAHYNEVMASLSEENERWRAGVTQIASEVDTAFLTLMNDITMANQTSVDARMTALAFQHQDELTKLAEKQVAYGVAYEGILALTNEKYRLMTEAAQGHYATVQQAAEAAGFSTRAELEAAAATAQDTYERMRVSGLYSIAAVKEAHAKAKAAEAAIDASVYLTKTQQFELIANAAKTFIGAIFGKGKAAAIATAIIDGAQAVVKALASAPPPLNYVLAAAVGVAALVQINKIRSTDIGYATGTPGTMFEDFGRGTVTTLHGEEAVVTKHQGDTLADQLLGAVTAREDRAAAATERLRADLKHSWDNLPILLRDAGLLA